MSSRVLELMASHSRRLIPPVRGWAFRFQPTIKSSCAATVLAMPARMSSQVCAAFHPRRTTFGMSSVSLRVTGSRHTHRQSDWSFSPRMVQAIPLASTSRGAFGFPTTIAVSRFVWSAHSRIGCADGYFVASRSRLTTSHEKGGPMRLLKDCARDRRANKPAAGNAGIASRLTIGHQSPGVPEPGR
jgi:hypothetical protein